MNLDDAGHRPSAGLTRRLQGLQCGARLRLEVAGVRRVAVRAVGDLSGDVEDRLRARYLDRLGIHRRVPDTTGSIGFDRGHGGTSVRLREYAPFLWMWLSTLSRSVARYRRR